MHAEYLPLLSMISVRENNLRDLGPLAYADQLRNVDISNNLIADLMPLGQTADFLEFYFNRNLVSSISPLMEIGSDVGPTASFHFNPVNCDEPATQYAIYDMENMGFTLEHDCGDVSIPSAY